MIALALDTSTEDIALAVARLARDAEGHFTYRVLASADGPAPRKANTQLLPRVQEMFESLGLEPADIDRVVCGRGPGSFTGVRIGVASAKGIATALHVPLHGVLTLDAIAAQVWLSGYRGQLGVLDDAMRGEVYPARFQLDDAGFNRLATDRVADPTATLEDWAGTPGMLVCGNAIPKYAVLVDGYAGKLTFAPEHLWLPTGEGLLAAHVADERAGRLDSGDAGSLLPLYTRLADAEENERKRAAGNSAVPSPAIPAEGVDGAAALGGLLLRPLSLSDVPYLAALEKRVFTDAAQADAWSAGMLTDELYRSDRVWWVALEKGALVGWAGGWVVDGTLQILGVGCDPAYRRQGVARRLLGRLAMSAMDLGAQSITLEVRVANTAAQTLYTSLGLTSRGVRRHYYPDGTDAFIMSGALPLATAHVGAANEPNLVAGMRLQEEEHAASKGLSRPLILALESSCDETAAAVIDGDGVLRSDVIASQIDFHARFGGVVPEIASRKHVEAIVGVAEEALAVAGRKVGDTSLDFTDLSAVAVTSRPGLVGALVVGIAFAKGLSWAAGIPLVEVNHLEGHLYANKLITPDIEPPLVALLVSGGHTMLVGVDAWGSYRTMGETLDDAVGEAFDKVAKALGLGYPGGPVISRLAKQGNPRAVDFPRAMMHSGDLRFSLSGLKTAVITYIHNEEQMGRCLNLPDIAASFQQAVVDVLVSKSLAALDETGASEFCLGGGVAANPELRDSLKAAIERTGVRVTLPPLSACTDNAGMIAVVALARYNQGRFADLSVDAHAHAPLDEAY